MLIEIKNGFAEIKYKKGKRTYEKIVTIPALVSAMSTDIGLQTPFLPPGTRSYTRKDNKHILVIEIPASQRMINYLNREKKIIFEGIIPLPWGVIKMILGQQGSDEVYVIEKAEMYALERPIFSELDPLYHFPLPNIGSEGSICWGGTFNSNEGNNRFKNIQESGRVIDYFFSSNYNTDISPKLSVYARYEDFLRSSKDEKFFKYDLLVKTNKNISSLLK